MWRRVVLASSLYIDFRYIEILLEYCAYHAEYMLHACLATFCGTCTCPAPKAVPQRSLSSFHNLQAFLCSDHGTPRPCKKALIYCIITRRLSLTY